MTEFIRHPDYEEAEFRHPYICSYSPMLRTAVKIDGRSLKRFIEEALDDVAGNEEVAESLQRPCSLPGSIAFREVDFSAGPGHPTILKCLVWWEPEKKIWVVFAEGGEETYWEDHWKAMGRG
jgi:hypothetical protein